MLDKAEALHPLHVLPGHGEPGGTEILEGQRSFIEDLLDAVRKQAAEGLTPEKMTVSLPARDRDWTPADLSTDVGIAYAEITEHKPAGDIPHEWK